MAQLLSVRGVSKRFPGVQALDKVNLDLNHGEVLALVGENGAGKSTLMKILSGVYRPDAGKILMEEQEVTPRDPIYARDHLGISIIYQEFNLASNLSVAENIYLGRLPTRRGFVQYDKLYRQAEEFLELLGADLDPRAPVSHLSVAQQQMVEVAKAISYQARLLIMDEPTAALTMRETRTLFKVVAGLRAKGVGTIFITHRLDEIFEIADRITVMRDGRTVGSLPVHKADRASVIRLMVDRDLSELFPTKEASTGTPLLEVRHLSTPDLLRDISFTLHRGEIVGVFGLMGAGRTELAYALFGVGSRPQGEVRLGGQPITVRSPADATRAGLGYVPEDRKIQGLILPMSVRENVTLAVLHKISQATMVRTSEERQVADRFIKTLDIRTPGREQRVNNLSGGNQQKVVVAKWLANDPKVLILDEPTRGIDVSAKAEVHTIMARLAEQGVGVIMISSDLPEVLGMSDRVLVMHKGHLTGEFSRAEATQERIMQAATGTVISSPGPDAGVTVTA
jgi:ribose transport system ATP-binding protein